MSARNPETPLLDAAIRFDNLPASGRRLEVRTTADQRKAIANRLGVDSVDRLSANLEITPIKRGLEVRGRLQAEVTQPCVVTFEPVGQSIDEEVRRLYLPGREADYAGPAGAEIFIDLESDDLPDYFDGPEIDFTELLLETLSLAVDPYPRSPGARLPKSDDPVEDQDNSPFARHKELKSTRD